MIQIQTDMTERAIELLNLDPSQGPYLILDVGCGSGLSGQVISKKGWHWMGLDISSSMLTVANENMKSYNNDEMMMNEDDQKMKSYDDNNDDMIESESDDDDDNDEKVFGDLFLQDMGQGVGYRPGTFDGLIRYVRKHHYIILLNYDLAYLPCNGYVMLMLKVILPSSESPNFSAVYFVHFDVEPGLYSR